MDVGPLQPSERAAETVLKQLVSFLLRQTTNHESGLIYLDRSKYELKFESLVNIFKLRSII